MSSARPPYHRSASHGKLDNGSYDNKENVSRHYVPVQGQHTRPRRPRSPSRVRHPRTPHPSNCSRRRWPPSPKVEDAKNEEDIPMRGKIGQDPMIIDVPSSDSGSNDSGFSDDSSEPEMPPAFMGDNRETRFVLKSEYTNQTSPEFDKMKNAKPARQRSTMDLQSGNRGRISIPKLDTDIARSKSTGGPTPTLERARSPYASGPQDRKPKPDRSSGEYLLSPDVMSPRAKYAESPRTQSQYFPRPVEGHGSGRPDQGKDMSRQPVRPSLEGQRAHSHYLPRPVDIHDDGRHTQGMNSPSVFARPSTDRRASDKPYPIDSPSAGSRPGQDWASKQPVRPPVDRRTSDRSHPSTPPSAGPNWDRSKRPHGPFDDSDSDHARARGHSGRMSPQKTPKYSTTNLTHGSRDEKNVSATLPKSPPHRSIPSSDTEGAPVNLSSLVSGAAITQTLNAILNGDHAAGRRASPRPSPRVSPLASPHGSPKSSPYSSPPRTPPSEPSHHGANPIAGLKKDSPSSKPSSPLSSPSSTWTAEPGAMPREVDHDGRRQSAPLRSRRTTPLPSPLVEEPVNLESLRAPGIVVRSPSPAKHTKLSSTDSIESHHPKSVSGPVAPKDSPQMTSLRPTGFSGRPRAASSADIRPQLTVNPAPFLQASDSPSSPRTRSRPASPNLASPLDRYKPSNLEPASPASRSRSSHPEPTSASTRSRSRSYVPEPNIATRSPSLQTSAFSPTAPAPRSRSSVPAPALARARSTSRATKPAGPASKQVNLPGCPRPRSIAGYDDWYTLHHNTAFAICPTCRDNVFGANYEHYLKPRPTSSTRKTLCDLNNPWVRVACVVRGPDGNLLSALSDITSKEHACPQDDSEPRDWYRLEDAGKNKHISGFTACPHCVHSLEAVFPSWRNVFYRSRHSYHQDPKERHCSLRTSALRFMDYLDMLVESAREAESKRKAPNTNPVCELAKQLAAVDECPKDKMFPRKAWHIHPHLPEFTICQECYEEVVYPLVKTGSALAAKIDKKPQQFPNPEVEVCCHLYSPRMRRVFREACEDDDYEHLRHTVLKRHMLQQDILATLLERTKYPRDDEVKERLGELLVKWKDRE